MDVDAFWELMLAAVDAADLAAPMNKSQRIAGEAEQRAAQL
jgi:hypothetical protein